MPYLCLDIFLLWTVAVSSVGFFWVLCFVFAIQICEVVNIFASVVTLELLAQRGPLHQALDAGPGQRAEIGALWHLCLLWMISGHRDVQRRLCFMSLIVSPAVAFPS